MNPEQKRRRSGVFVLIAVLVVVSGWWLLFVPHTAQYKASKKKSELRARLLAIKPPAECKYDEIAVRNFENAWFAMAACTTVSSSENVKVYYIQELARHGYAYKGEETTDELQSTLKFSQPGYDVSVEAMRLDKKLTKDVIYTIVLTARD